MFDGSGAVVADGAVGGSAAGAVTAGALVDRIGVLERHVRAGSAAQLVDIVAFDDAQRELDRAGGVAAHLVGRTVGVQVALTLGSPPAPAPGGSRSPAAWCTSTPRCCGCCNRV